MTVQEGFREAQYKIFSVFIIYNWRDTNKIKEFHESKYYRMKTYYFTYGIIDCSKFEHKEIKDLLNMPSSIWKRVMKS